MSIRRDFKISRSAGALLNRSLLRVAKRGASVLAWIACAATHPPCGQAEALPAPVPGRDASVAEGDSTRIAREAMVQEQIEARGVRNAAVLAGMRRVPRHEFMPENVRSLAYYDRPVPIGLGQTISQPYVVALMTELAAVGRGSRVLEIGTGSGYQAAVLAELGTDVYSIEILAPLRERAVEILARLGYGQVKTRVGDGYLGWPEAAPFDAIIVTAAPARVPEPLKQQLKVGGRLVLPVGKVDQELEVITRTAVGFSERSVIPVRFVPMTGKANHSR
jgi:protein-L-isoaspartate(D-aspartate) O-methyltransferase